MTTYENNTADADLTPAATLDSIFEMEQLVEILDQHTIPWRVVEHGDIIFKSFSGNIGHATLWVEKNQENKAKQLLVSFRQEQAKGHECERCGLMLGPDVERCPACLADGDIDA